MTTDENDNMKVSIVIAKIGGSFDYSNKSSVNSRHYSLSISFKCEFWYFLFCLLLLSFNDDTGAKFDDS